MGIIGEKVKEKMIKVKVLKDLDFDMTDLRPGYAGLLMGTLEDVARQNGILCQAESGYVLCSAPQNRMQIFVDKLDCCAIEYEVLED